MPAGRSRGVAVNSSQRRAAIASAGSAHDRTELIPGGTDVSDLHDTLEELLRLQGVESDLLRVEAALVRVPLRLGEIERTLEGAERAVTAARARLQDGGKERRALEQEIETVKVQITRHQDQLMQVKTNDQYRAMTKEIANEKAKIDGFEEKILINLERQDDLGKAVKDREADLAREKERVSAEKVTLLAEQTQLEGEKKALGAARATICAGLPADALALFRRVVQMRGTAVSRVKGATCGECGVRARPQPLAEARLRERLVQCENCHRILYAEPLPPTAGPTAVVADDR
jgi:hypothetical protein